MRTFQEYLVDKYAVPFLEYINTLDEESQLDLISSLSEETLIILECVSTGQEFEASNTAFNELRYDLNEEFQLDEGSGGERSLKRKDNAFRTKHPGKKSKYNTQILLKTVASEKRANKRVNNRLVTASAKKLMNPKFVKAITKDDSYYHRLGQRADSHYRKSQGQPETRKPGSVDSNQFWDKRSYR